MPLSKFLDPKNDVAFKKIFGEEASKPHLISFLNSVLNLEGETQIITLEFLNPYQAPKIAGKKISFIDVLVTDQRNIRYVVEMQMLRVPGFEKRAQYYAAKTYVSQHNSAADYPKLNQVYFLGIADHIMFPDKRDYKSDHLILDNKTHEHDLKDISFTFIELPKFSKSVEECLTVEDKWLHFLKHAPEEGDIPALIQEESIISAYKALERYGWSDAEMHAYEDADLALVDNKGALTLSYEEGMQKGIQKGVEKGKTEGIAEGIEKGKVEGIAEGIEKGIEKGKMEQKYDIARTMLKKGISHDVISEVTELDADIIRQMKVTS